MHQLVYIRWTHTTQNTPDDNERRARIEFAKQSDTEYMAPTITTVANSDKSTSLRASPMTLAILRYSFFLSAALSRCRRSVCPVISSFLSGHERVYDMAASCVSVLYTGNTVCVLLCIETVALVGPFTLLRHPIEEEPPTCTTSYRQCRQQLLCPFRDLC